MTAGLDAETRARVAPLLGHNGAQPEHLGQATEAARRAAAQRFDLVACAYPLPDMVLRDFVAAVRHRDSASRDAAVLVLTLPEMRSEASRVLTGGRSLALSRRDPPALLSRTVRHLLGVEPRRSIDAPVRLLVDSGGGTSEVEAELVNLSRTGMLVRHRRRLGIGTRCEFELRLRGLDSPITGNSEVARHSLPARERVHGFALRFVDLDETARQLLDAGLAVTP
jgi:CheY-like chemotaxis protein